MRLSTPQLIAIALLTACAATRAGTINTELESSEIFLGENTVYTVTYVNLDGVEKPDLSHLEKDFKFEYLDMSTSNQASFINGQVSRISKVVYYYRLQPKNAGRQVVTGPTITINGRNQKAPDQALNVIAPEKQDLVIVEIVPSKSQLYVTQEFDVTVRIFVRPLPDAPNRDPISVLRRAMPALSINWMKEPEGLSSTTFKEWLEPLLSSSGRGFMFDRATGFNIPQLFNFYIGIEKRADLGGTARDYHVYELKRRFRADKPGSYSFGPAIVKGEFVDGLHSSGPQRGYYSLKLTRTTAPEVSVQVRTVPADHPVTFSGAIGDYRLTSSATPTNLRVGDPLTLSLTMERGNGAGSLDLVSAPDLAANEKFAADFEIVDRNPTGEVNGNTKRFSYSVRPKRAGVSIPELSASIFDPEKEKFSEITAPAIPLKVTEAAALNASDIVGTLGKRNAQDLRSADNGIFQNVSDVRELRNEKTNPVHAGLAVGLAWIVSLSGCLFLSRRRSFASDTAWQRREGARSAASRKLNEARNATPAQAARFVREAVVGLVADLRNKPAAGFTPADALGELSGAPAELQATTRALLESLEAVEYAPQSAIDSAVYIRKAEELLPELHRALEKSR